MESWPVTRFERADICLHFAEMRITSFRIYFYFVYHVVAVIAQIEMIRELATDGPLIEDGI